MIGKWLGIKLEIRIGKLLVNGWQIISCKQEIRISRLLVNDWQMVSNTTRNYDC